MTITFCYHCGMFDETAKISYPANNEALPSGTHFVVIVRKRMDKYYEQPIQETHDIIWIQVLNKAHLRKPPTNQISTE